MPAPTLMRQEIEEIPRAVARLLERGGPQIAAAAAALRAADPGMIVTVARGSSDHVCTGFKYAAEIMTGRPVASLGPSLASIYGAALKLEGAVCLGVSQSGRSPDIVAMSDAARKGGAFSLALTNDPASPLAGLSDHVIDIHAGPELSVAATKTYVTSAVAALWLLAEWQRDAGLLAALKDLPAQLEKAGHLTWPELRAALAERTSLFTLGRGLTFATSNEAALKFKETCQLHAESYSAAEVLHGPVSIVDEGFPVLCFAGADAAEDSLAQAADDLTTKGARVFATTSKVAKATVLEHVATGHPMTEPLSLLVSFYAMVEAFATSRGGNPDAPRNLRKVTETL
ncbi:SIS domain-containing protein [Pelagibaca abyssi]|nr:SIS domain-containing protein [Salipiger abyssi]